MTKAFKASGIIGMGVVLACSAALLARCEHRRTLVKRDRALEEAILVHERLLAELESRKSESPRREPAMRRLFDHAGWRNDTVRPSAGRIHRVPIDVPDPAAPREPLVVLPSPPSDP